MQKHVTNWEETKDPQGNKSLADFQKYFVKYASRHHSNQQELKEAGIVNHVDAADKQELAATKAKISALRNQVNSIQTDVMSVVNAAMTSASSNTGNDASIPTQISSLPSQANQVGSGEAMMQTILSRMAQMDGQI